MAVQANFDSPERDKFQYCYSKLMVFLYRDEEAVKTDLNLLLDQLNSLEYGSIVVKEQDGNRLLHKFCSIIPLHEERFVVKLCQIITCWKRKQMLQLTEQCLFTVTDYLVKAILRCQAWTRPDILRALATLLYESCDKVSDFHDALLGKQGVLVQLINDDVTDTDTLKEAVLCVECLTLKPASSSYLMPVYVNVCFDVFTMLLHKIAMTSMDQISQCRIIINCLRAIQNMLQVTKIMPVHKLGTVLAAVRVYMFFGLYSQKVVIPESLYPSQLTKHDIPLLGKMSETPSAKYHTDKEDNSGQKKTKRKTKKKSEKQSNKPDDNDEHGDQFSSQKSAGAMATGTDMDMLSLQPMWAKISSSESEWSDTEGGQNSRLRSNCTKVRQCALSCFYWIAKTTDKKMMFSYWSSFIPDTHTAANMTNTQTLFTIVLKDPSPKCRMGALAALSVLVDGTKMLLNAAEDSDEKKTSTFTPFSVVLGSTIKEMHRCLLLAMVSEEYPITLTQLIKCFGSVIANVPYHRMRPGLLSRIVKQIRHFIYHRDPNVRVACLTCLGSMSGIQPPLMEVCHIIQPPQPPVSAKPPATMDTDPAMRVSASGLSVGQTHELDSGFSSSPNVNLSSSFGTLQSGGANYGEHSGGTTPKKGTASSSGIQTPVFSDQLLNAHAKDISWVVKLCVKNILPQSSTETVFGMEDAYVEPLPVRLESLQVLAHLTKGYFPIIRNCVPLLQELVHKCYCDTDPVIKLHTAKLLDEFTQVLLQDLQNKTSDTMSVERLDKQQVLDFWLSLLNGPIQDILQNPTHGPVRATTCDCIANIGDEIFIALPMDKQRMCLTVILGLTNDEDRFIRASAIRTLGVYVLYKSLREDVSFIADSTSAILGAMDDKNMGVRVKAAWSLANLCDALALNREEGDTEFIADFSEIMLLNVITMATKACQDGDKVKANGVRALGNILRYITMKNLGKERFSQAVSTAVKSLVKNVGSGAMKVRWNACYAVSNLYKNTDLKCGSAIWNIDLIKVLCTVVKDCKNFKVRINAAIALSSPRERSQYGDAALYTHVWQGIIDAFGTAEDIADNIDFRYRDSLTDQICVTVLRLVTLLQVADLDNLASVMQTHGDRLMTSMDKYCTYKQKDSQIDIQLPLAISRLEVLGIEALSDVQASCVDMLTSMCKQLTPDNIKQNVYFVSEEDGEKLKVKTAFVQTYD